MRNVLSISVLSVLLLCTSRVNAQTCISQGTGNWGVASTWSCDGTARVPACGDTIQIATGHEVTVTDQYDFTACGSTMAIDVYGTLTFTNGNKVRLPCGSLLSVQSSGIVRKSGAGGGSSTLISICGTDVWTAGDGQLNGPTSFGGAILPVELLFFRLERQEAQLFAVWATASETDHDCFELEVSDGTWYWDSVGSIAGDGKSNVRKDYRMLLPNHVQQSSYLRLKQIDLNGKVSYSETLVIPRIQSDIRDELLIYPNPVHSFLHIRLPEDAIKHVGVTDVLGKLVYEVEVNGAFEKTLAVKELGLAPGVYYLQSDGGKFDPVKFVVSD